jgi:hypothetical protein
MTRRTITREQAIALMEQALELTWVKYGVWLPPEVAEALREHARTAPVLLRSMWQATDPKTGEKCYCPAGSIGAPMAARTMFAWAWDDVTPYVERGDIVRLLDVVD